MDDLKVGGEWAAKTVQRPPQPQAQPPVRQLGTAIAGTTPAGPLAAVPDRKQRSNATCEGEDLVTVQGPVKKQHPDGMSPGGGEAQRRILNV